MKIRFSSVYDHIKCIADYQENIDKCEKVQQLLTS